MVFNVSMIWGFVLDMCLMVWGQLNTTVPVDMLFYLFSTIPKDVQFLSASADSQLVSRTEYPRRGKVPLCKFYLHAISNTVIILLASDVSAS